MSAVALEAVMSIDSSLRYALLQLSAFMLPTVNSSSDWRRAWKRRTAVIDGEVHSQ